MSDNDPAQERTDEHLDTQDAADLWTPESAYDPRPFRLWWRGAMTYDEYCAYTGRIKAARAAYYEWLERDTFRLMAEMGW